MAPQISRVLPVIVISQFFCTSLWFAGNAIIADITRAYSLDESFLAHLVSAVQLGFISGTLVFALLTISDRFSPTKVFFTSAVIAAFFNLGMIIQGEPVILMVCRFLTGFFLAGIYPVGMKIASDHFKEGLGKSLGFLVGALVVGTALPHLVRSMTTDLPWKVVVFSTSALSVSGGLAMLILVPDGPYRKPGQRIDLSAFLSGFRNNRLRAAAFGYFGHMWELYTFWAFVPVMLAMYSTTFPGVDLDVSLLSFLIIGSGGLACVASGYLSQQFGAKRIAAISLLLSGICCIVSPWLLYSPPTLFVGFLFFWGLVVIADSPLFSTLVAQNAPVESRGTSLTIVNCIGFAITIISIQFINALSGKISPQFLYTILAAGPVLGLVGLLGNRK